MDTNLALCVPVPSSYCIQFISYSRLYWIFREYTRNHIISHHILSLSRHFSISSIWGHPRCFSLSSTSLIPDELMCSWCNRWWQDVRRRGRLWQHCGVNLTCFFFFIPLHLFFSPSYHLHSLSLSVSPALALHHFLSLTPPSLPFLSVLSPGGVRAGLLCPLRVGRVFKLYCSWQAWGKPTEVVDCVGQNEHVWSHKERGFSLVYKYCVYARAEVRSVLKMITTAYLTHIYTVE